MSIHYHVKGSARLATQLKQQNAREIKAGRPALIIEGRANVTRVR